MTDEEFEALVMAGPIVDMVGDGRMEYDGPRCALDCGTPVDDDGQHCDGCLEELRGGWSTDAMTVLPGEYQRTDRVWL